MVSFEEFFEKNDFPDIVIDNISFVWNKNKNNSEWTNRIIDRVEINKLAFF